jgi:hypothetical protein
MMSDDGIRPCSGCGATEIPLAPMLYDDVWARLAGARELLCVKCCFRRATERHVRLDLDALKPCAINITSGAFDFFSHGADPRSLPGWREADDTIQRWYAVAHGQLELFEDCRMSEGFGK